MAEPRDGGEHRAAYPAVARIARDDAEPTPGALSGHQVVPVKDRKRADDAQPRNAGKNFRSAWRRLEPLFRSRNERRSSSGRSIHPGVAAVPTAARLGTVAIDSEAPGRDQRPRIERRYAVASLGTASAVSRGAIGASDAPSCDGPPVNGQIRNSHKTARTLPAGRVRAVARLLPAAKLRHQQAIIFQVDEPVRLVDVSPGVSFVAHPYFFEDALGSNVPGEMGRVNSV